MKLYVKASDDWKEKHGIKSEGTGFGFSESEQKYYGWSHRAYYGFGIGHIVKDGDSCVGYDGIEPGFKCKILEDCKKVAKAFADSVS